VSISSTGAARGRIRFGSFHGYPDSFYRFAKIIPMLTDPESFGGRPEDAFDIVVPDLPGHGFSYKPAKPGAMFRVGDLWVRLMKDTLGYERFGAHGGDWGATVTEQLARSQSNSVVAIHRTMSRSGIFFKSQTTLHLPKRNSSKSLNRGFRRKEPTPSSSPRSRTVSLRG
jgi:hypothetical protein